MALELLDSQRCTVAVSLDDGNGNVTSLGRNFDGHFSDNALARFVNDPDGHTVWIEALAEGTGTVTIEKQDHSLPQTFDLIVTHDAGNVPPPPPGTPHLVVTFGSPEAKAG